MVNKRDKDAESGLQILSTICLIWAIGFLYWSRDGSLLGYQAGNWAMPCCSTINFLLLVFFTASWLYTRKENKIKNYLDEHFKLTDSISVDELSTKLKLKRPFALRTLRTWQTGSGFEGNYDETTGIFMRCTVPESEPSPPKEDNFADDL